MQDQDQGNNLDGLRPQETSGAGEEVKAGPPHSIGKEKAKALYDSRWWEGLSAREIISFQLHTAELCMPFGDFHGALEEALGRPVFTHELGLNYAGIMAEFRGEASAPTLQEIIDLIPAEKRIVLAIPQQEGQ